MEIGILSDTHNRYQLVEKALGLLEARKINIVLHCGDIEDEQTVHLFRGFKTHFVFGNCDWDKPALRLSIEEINGVLHEPLGYLELEGRRVAWTHGDDRRLFRQSEHSGQYDFLFYGHSHIAEQHRTGSTQVANPGALHRVRSKTFAILDLKDGVIESVTVE